MGGGGTGGTSECYNSTQGGDPKLPKTSVWEEVPTHTRDQQTPSVAEALGVTVQTSDFPGLVDRSVATKQLD